MSLLRSSAIIGSFTMLSRIFGFLRDVIIANVMGAGMLSDAFFVAFKIPNFLRRLFAEGAFNAAFLPMFAGMLKVDGQDAAMRFASIIMTILTLCLLMIAALAIFFMPEVLALIAPGYRDDPELLALTIDLSRVTFPYIIFISLVSLLSGILNSHDRFAAVAFTPVLLNLSLIFFILVLAPHFPSHAHALATGVFFAGLVQCLWLVWVCARHDSLPKFVRPQWTDDVRTMMRAFVPVAFGAGVAQVNQLIDIILATYLDTAVSYLYYADRLYELPLGVIGIAIATALLPMLSRHIRAKEHEEATAAINQALRFTALIGLPATAALIVIASPIVTVIYEHGAFSPEDSAAVIPALIAYACGLPAFLVIKIFSNCFFAAGDTKTPVKIAIVCVLTNLILNLILIEYYAHVGLAIATSAAGWLNAILLGYFLYMRHLFRPAPGLGIYLLKLLIAIAAMTFALLICTQWLNNWLTGHTLQRAGAMLILVVVGSVSYFVFAFICRAFTRQDVTLGTQKP